MSRLIDLIDEYRDRHGRPSEASIARAIGAAPQTINSWRNRGIRELPNPATMRRLAEYLGVPQRVVVEAALVDSGAANPEDYPVPHLPPIEGRGQRRA